MYTMCTVGRMCTMYTLYTLCCIQRTKSARSAAESSSIYIYTYTYIYIYVYMYCVLAANCYCYCLCRLEGPSAQGPLAIPPLALSCCLLTLHKAFSLRNSSFNSNSNRDCTSIVLAIPVAMAVPPCPSSYHAKLC